MINNVTLMGRLTADPELRTTTNGKSVCSFTIAVDKSFAKQGEQRTADFINIVAWEHTANFVCNYFSKGAMLALTGAIQTRQYEDKNGAKRTAFEVIAKEVSFCGSKNETQNDAATTQTTNDDFEEITSDEDLPF